ncbi:MAG: hypothetical protein LUB61_05365 [Eggerthellaceae bacterium]|nr:hypothetical protein [Eggerthellaceae bacterium]
MDSILEQVYATILPSAPYVIVAYALIWLILFIFVVIIMRGFRKAKRQMDVLEEEFEDKFGPIKTDDDWDEGK